MICQSFLVPDLLNNQSDFLKFFLRHDFVQNRFQVLFNGGRWDETPGWCILHYTILKWRKSIVSVIGSSQLTRTNIELCEIEGCQLPGILSHINVYIFFFWQVEITDLTMGVGIFNALFCAAFRFSNLFCLPRRWITCGKNHFQTSSFYTLWDKKNVRYKSNEFLWKVMKI